MKKLAEMSSKENSTTNTLKSNIAVNTKPYGKIVLTLQNCLLPEEKLNSTPSNLDGLDAETETDLRILGCELIQTAGILLKLPQVRVCHLRLTFLKLNSNLLANVTLLFGAHKYTFLLCSSPPFERVQHDLVRKHNLPVSSSNIFLLCFPFLHFVDSSCSFLSKDCYLFSD